MTGPIKLEAEFKEFLLALLDRTKEKTGYNPTKFRQMVWERGGVEAAKAVIRIPGHSYGFDRLWEVKRLDLSVEASVLENPKFHPLFTEEELEICQKSLKAYKYKTN